MIKVVRDNISNLEQDFIAYFGKQYSYLISKKLNKDVLFFDFNDPNIEDAIKASRMPFPEELRKVIESKVVANSVASMLVRTGKTNVSKTAGFVLNYVQDGRTKGAIVVVGKEELDHIVIHENLHVLSTKYCNDAIHNGFCMILLEPTDDDTFLIKDLLSNKKSVVDDKKYQTLNEVMTDLITTIILKKRRIENNQIVDVKSLESIYSLAFPLFIPVYLKNKALFDKAYIEGDVGLLERTFGGEQLEKFDSLLNKCIELRRLAPEQYVHFLNFIKSFAGLDNEMVSNAFTYIYYKGIEDDLLRSAGRGDKTPFIEFVELYATASKNFKMMELRASSRKDSDEDWDK